MNPNRYFDISGSSLIKKGDTPEFWQAIMWCTPHLDKPHFGDAAGCNWEKILFATDEAHGEENLIENIIRFNRVLDACNLPERRPGRTCTGVP